MVYLSDPKNSTHVYSYNLTGLQKSPHGWKSTGQGADYFYYLNVGEAMKSMPQPSCSDAQTNCQAGGCAGFQTSTDGSACYAVGDANSLQASFFNPDANEMSDECGGEP